MNSELIIIEEITKTCIACPAQWEGTTTDGRSVYIRYRHGHLRLDLSGATVFGADFVHEGGADGVLDYDELRQLLPISIVLPEEEKIDYGEI